MTLWLNPFMRCECGKVHVRTFVGPNTVCTCGRNLYWKAWS
jgi:hypothetical protein